MSDDTFTVFQNAEMVQQSYRHVATTAQQITNGAQELPLQAFLDLATKIVYAFGIVHPFLDGNGHIQRLIFAASIFERGDVSLDPRWSIHPRPYAEGFALAFEQPTPAERLGRLRSELCKYVLPAKP